MFANARTGMPLVLYRSGLSNCGARVDEVMACYLMTGDTDYLIRIAVTDMGRWKNSSLSSLRRFPALKNTFEFFAQAGPVQDRLALACAVMAACRAPDNRLKAKAREGAAAVRRQDADASFQSH